MNCVKNACCFKGRADLRVREKGDPCAAVLVPDGPWIDFGNYSGFKINYDFNELEQTSLTLDVGAACSFKELSKVTFEFSSKCYSDLMTRLSNYANGTEGNVPAAPVINELVPAGSVVKGSAIIPQRIGGKSFVVTTVGGATTYLQGTDYIVRGSAIVPTLGGAIVDGVALHIDYAAPEQTSNELFTNFSKRFEIFLDGLNDIDGKQFAYHLYNVDLSASEFVVVGDGELGEAPMSGTALPDFNKTPTIFVPGTSPSNYGRFTRVV